MIHIHFPPRLGTRITQEQARRNAQRAMMELAQRRLEREDAERYLAEVIAERVQEVRDRG